MKFHKRTKLFLSLFLLLTCAILIVGCLTNPFAQEKIPDTPAGKRLKESLDVIDSGEYGLIKAYIEDNLSPNLIELFSMDWLINFHTELHEIIEEFDFHGTRKSSETRITGIFKNKHTGLRLDLSFTVQSKPPHKIRGIDLILLRLSEDTRLL
jgi:hypothetical protein